MIIREMTEKDLGTASAICMEAFNQAVAGSLSDEGVSTFSKIASPEAFRKRMQEDNVMLVAEERGKVKGVVELREGRHVAMFFVAPRHQGKGIGKRLLMSVLDRARVEVVTVSASLASVPVYRRCGFECAGDVAELSGLVYQPMELKLETAAHARTDVKEDWSAGYGMPQPVIQEEATGCGIASVANILGKTYAQMKATANAMGIHAEDRSLWSDTQHVRRLLSGAGVETSADEIPFESWESLPDLALLSIKHHQEGGRNFWHWVVFKRVDGRAFVLDSASYLPSNVRTDFDLMQPKWFIEVRGGQLHR